jgi:hypothetical protein
MSKIYFLTFGGPSQNYHAAVHRLCEQAKSLNIFDYVYGYTEQDLKTDVEFWSKHGNFIENNSKGYGYWLWKPYLIKKILGQMQNDDVLLYLDSGCELNTHGKDKMIRCINEVKNKLIMGTSTGTGDDLYTKMDLIKYFNYQNDYELLRKPQMQACIVLMIKCDKIVQLYNEFYDIGTNYNLINDVNIEKKLLSFIDHRHDQSIFSLLVKKYMLINYDLDPTWIVNFYDENMKRDLYDAPIWCARNRTGNTLINFKK